MADEIAEAGGELAGGQVDRLVFDLGDVAELIERQVAGLEAPARRDRGAAPQGADPGDQLGEGEWLGEIVVGPGVKPDDPLVHCSERGQHQHRRHQALRAEQAQERDPVHVREHPVEDDHVIWPALGEGGAGHPVGRHVDNVALRGQDAFDQGGHLGFVLDHENLHRWAFCVQAAPASRFRWPVFEASHPGHKAVPRRAPMLRSSPLAR